MDENETLQGEVVNEDGTPAYNPEEDPRFQVPEKTSWDIWHDIDIPELAGIELNNIQHCNGQLIAVGDKSTLVVKGADGNWTVTKVAVDEELDINNICFGNGTYVITCSCGCVFYSTDLVEWTRATVDGLDNTDHLYGNAIYGTKNFVVVGNNGKILHSTDGKAWAMVESGTTENLYEVIYAKKKKTFVAVGHGATILTSTDGKTWTMVETTIPPVPYYDRPDIECIFYSEALDLFISLGAMNNICHSSDLKTWEPGPIGITNPVYSVAYGNGKFVAVGDSLIASSEDAIGWGFLPYSHTEYLLGVEFEGNVCYAVGTNGRMVYCDTAAPVPVEESDETVAE